MLRGEIFRQYYEASKNLQGLKSIMGLESEGIVE